MWPGPPLRPCTVAIVRSHSGRSAASAIRHGLQQPQARPPTSCWQPGPLTCPTRTKVHLLLWSLGIPGQLSRPWLGGPLCGVERSMRTRSPPTASGRFCKMEAQGPGRPEDVAEEDTGDHQVSEFTARSWRPLSIARPRLPLGPTQRMPCP